MPVHQFQELDSKNSPLALLVQICSNIGADKHDTKPLVSSSDKSSDPEKNKEAAISPHETIFPTDPSKKKDPTSSDSGGDKKASSSSSKSATPSSSRGSPTERASTAEDCRNSSPAASDPSVNKSSKPSSSSRADLSSPAASNSGSQSSLNGLTYAGLDLGSRSTDASSSATAAKEGFSAMSHLGLGAFKSAINSPLSSSCTGCSPVPPHLSVDSPHTFPPVSIATQSGALKAAAAGFAPLGAASLSPYLSYARVKTSTGSTAILPVCRDPYCTNCQLSTCSSTASPFTSDRLAPAHFPTSAFLPGLTGSLSSAVAVSAVPNVPSLTPHLYSHAMLARPNVCSWMVGDTYCGKRFATSEELLQHLRTHTTLAAAAGAATLPLFTPSVSALDAACNLHYSTSPSLTTSAGLRRSYPTSLSPVNSLSSVASRYHPYKPPLPTLPGSPMAPMGHPGLSMYYSPYSLYGKS